MNRMCKNNKIYLVTERCCNIQIQWKNPIANFQVGNFQVYIFVAGIICLPDQWHKVKNLSVDSHYFYNYTVIIVH